MEEPQTIFQKFKEDVLREGSKNGNFPEFLDDTENIIRGSEDHILEDPEDETHFFRGPMEIF